MERLEEQEFEWMLQQTRELVGIIHDAVARCSVSENEFWIWYSLIILQGDVTQQDICSAWSLHKQTVNTIVSGMVKKGYAVLETIPGTRNRKRICLTEAGRAYGETVVRPVFEAEKRTYARMSREDKDALHQFMGNFLPLLRQELQEIG